MDKHKIIEENDMSASCPSNFFSLPYCPTESTCLPNAEPHECMIGPENTARRYFYISFQNLEPNKVYQISVINDGAGGLGEPIFDSIVEPSFNVHFSYTQEYKTEIIAGRIFNNPIGFSLSLDTRDVSVSNFSIKIKYLMAPNDMPGKHIIYKCSLPLPSPKISSQETPEPKPGICVIL